MTTLSLTQIRQRWDNLPDVLREAIASQENSTLLWGTCANEHLPKEKTQVVARVFGLGMMGLLHTEELVAEIKNQAGIDQKISESIVRALEPRLLRPYKTTLDELLATPAHHDEPPRPVSDVQKPVAPPPASRIAFVPPPQTPVASLSTPLPSSPKPSAAPPPVFLHQETSAAPVQGVAFKPILPADQHIRDTKFSASPLARPARVELGGAPTPKPVAPSVPLASSQIAFKAPNMPPTTPAAPPPIKPLAPLSTLPVTQKPVPPLAPQGATPAPGVAHTIHYTDFKTPVGAPQTPSLPRPKTPEPAMPLAKPGAPTVPTKPIAPPTTSAFADRGAPPLATKPTAPSIPTPHISMDAHASAPAVPAKPSVNRPLPPPPPPPPPANQSRTSPSPMGNLPVHPNPSLTPSTPSHGPQEFIDTEALKKVTEMAQNGGSTVGPLPGTPMPK